MFVPGSCSVIRNLVLSGAGGGILGVNISLLTVCVFVWFCFMLDVVVSYHDSTLSIKYVQPHINFIILSNF